jgi:hypothetical protein
LPWKLRQLRVQSVDSGLPLSTIDTGVVTNGGRDLRLPRVELCQSSKRALSSYRSKASFGEKLWQTSIPPKNGSTRTCRCPVA